VGFLFGPEEVLGSEPCERGGRGQGFVGEEKEPERSERARAWRDTAREAAEVQAEALLVKSTKITNSLADLESRQQESLFARQNHPPMDPSARSQFRAICYRQISARIGHAVAKASVMRLLGVPRLPLPSPVPRYALAQNCPGPADSFSHPVPISYASSLQSLPPPSSVFPSPAFSP
jgi:hypothetical protein